MVWEDHEASILGEGRTFADYTGRRRRPGWPDITHDAFVDDYKRIADYLCGGPASLHPSLQNLENAVAAKIAAKLTQQAQAIQYTPAGASLLAKDHFDRKAEQFKAAHDSPQGLDASNWLKDDAYRGILTEVLADEEQIHGFTMHRAPERKVPTLVRLHTPAEFGKLWQTRQQFKDPGAQLAHGEFTHRIQWYCLCKDQAAGLANQPAAIFERMAQYMPVDRHAVDGVNPTALWDALFDRFRNSTARDKPYHFHEDITRLDFRSPERLNIWLLNGSGEQYPILRSFLTSRFQKRSTQRSIAVRTVDGDFDVEYLAEHYFKRSFARLPQHQQQLVRDIKAKGQVRFR